MKRMLINATQSEEVRLAMVDGQKLLNFEIEHYGREQRKGNIYKATITRIEPSLEACFVDYGEERQGFLPFKEISRQYFAPSDTPIGQIKINEAVKVGQQLVVQVEKEERGNKNAALTTFISLAGRYLVLMPNKPRSGGISRRIEGDERQDLKNVMSELTYPKNMSIIARTAGIGRATNELQWDLDYLLSLWSAVSNAADAQEGSFLIYNESALVIRAIRDYYTSDIKEILIDTVSLYNQAHQFMTHIMPDDTIKVKFYQDDAPLFARFQIEKQIESAYAREIKLPSGGSIVLDHTEALVAVDVNSARSTKGGDIEETATNTNLEAADEIARQLRLRDLGGLIVIDFIDMEEESHRQEVENRLRNALKQDRARVQYSSISRFGLLELSRQRLRPALFEGASISCPRCNGTGHIRDTESTSLQILRRIQEESLKGDTAIIKILVPVDVASYLLNKKREELTKIEMNNNINVLLIPSKQLETPNYTFERLKEDDPELENLQNTYFLTEKADDAIVHISKPEQKVSRQEPVIKNHMPATAPAPIHVSQEKTGRKKEENTSSGGVLGWIKSLFSSKNETTEEKETPNNKENNTRRKNSSKNNKDEKRSQDQKQNKEDNKRSKRSAGATKTQDRKNDRQDKIKQDDRLGQKNNTSREEEPNSSENSTRQRNPRKSRQKADEDKTTTQNEKQTRPSQQRRGRTKKEETEEHTVNTATSIASTALEQKTEEPPLRQKRKEQVSRADSSNGENMALDIAQETPTTEDGSEQNERNTRTRRTRDRYGRDRRQRTDRSDEETIVANEKAPLVPFDTKVSETTNKLVVSQETPSIEDPTPIAGSQESNAQEKAKIIQPQLDFNTASSHSAAADKEVITKTPTEEKSLQNASIEKSATPYALPENELENVAKNAGLEWVSTNHALAEKVQTAIRNTPQPQMGRAMKQGTEKNNIHEALVMVETQKTLQANKTDNI